MRLIIILLEPVLTSKGCELYFMSVNPINRKMLSNTGRADRSEAELRRMNVISEKICLQPIPILYVQLSEEYV